MTIYEQLQEADKLPKSNEPLDLMELFKLAYELKLRRELEEELAASKKEDFLWVAQ